MLPLRALRHVFHKAEGIVRIRDFDGYATLNLKLSEHMQSRIFWMGYYNREIVDLLDQILFPGMTVLDIGGNLGEIALVAARRVCGSGRVIAFEPVSSLAETLRQNAETNNLDQVEVVQLGLSDQEGEVEIFTPCAQGPAGEENSGLSTIYPGLGTSDTKERVSLTTLDNYISRHPLNRIDLIKIDIEGAELPCLRGAENALRRFRPALIVEVQQASAAAAGYEQADILQYLEGIGYQFQVIGKRGALTPTDSGSLGDFQNIFCTFKVDSLPS